MAKLNFDEVKKSLAGGKFSNIYYIYGADTVACEALTKTAVNTFVRKGDEDFSLSIFNAHELNFDELYEALERAPFFAPFNCVLIKDLNADALAAGVFPDLFKKLSDLGEKTVLIISITGFDVLMGKKAPVKNNKKLMDFCEKSGVLCCCAQKTANELADFIVKKCAKSKALISKQNALYLAELCCLDSALIDNETNKLIDFANGAEIDANIINSLTPRTLSADVFSVARAIGSFDSRKSMALLADVFDRNTDEIAVCATLVSSFVDLYRAKCAAVSGKTAEEAAADFGMNNRVFVMRNNMRDTRGMSLTHLAKCLEILKKTDRELKSTSADKRMLVEKAVTEMLMVKYG